MGWLSIDVAPGRSDVGELISIGEFSGLCQLSVKMLRHYDAIGLLAPAHVDPVSGYRFYRLDQLVVAAAIRELRAVDMPLADIRSVLGAAGQSEIHDVLVRHRERLAHQLVDSERRLVLIEELVAKESPMVDVTEVELPPLRVAARTVEGPTAMTVPLVTNAFHELFAAMQRDGIELVGPPIQVVHHGDEERFEHEVCLPIAADTVAGSDIVVRDLVPEPAAVARHSGPLDEANLVVHSIMGWVEGTGRRPGMPFRVALLAMPPLFTLPEFSDAADPVVEIAVPIRERRSSTAP
jgi:DNA-binding transcriptional MerR regulator